jgi:2-polyprenyl-3-methyl-5-hydroxy-6-metoxy-1,4-benzoquinol methylase
MKANSGESISSCYLCGSVEYSVCPGKVRDNNELEVRKCSHCGLVFLSSDDHITENFYELSGMHAQALVDFTAWRKESTWDDARRFTALQRLMENRTVLDVGCGNGGFLMLARAVAATVSGIEPDELSREYIARDGIAVFAAMEELDGIYDVITLFHVLEHVREPREFLARLADRLAKNGQLVVEVPNADDSLLSLYRNEQFSSFTYWSCHLRLFSRTTLATLAKQSGLTVNYIKQVQRYPLSNHLHWLACGKPGGHKQWSFLDSTELNEAYEKQLAAIDACDTVLASFSRQG